jgi:hypothetical protein
MSDEPLDTWLDFKDLQQANIVPNWPTLRAWQDDPEIQFPKGRLFGPNSRRWSKRHEIEPWIASRPTALKAVTPACKPRGRHKECTRTTESGSAP